MPEITNAASPFFSVIVPCYNQAHFLSECVHSVIKQNFIDWELIIVNDGSTDNTQEVAEGLARQDHRIRIVEKSNGGLSSARNAGIAIAHGECYHFLDADDYMMQECLYKIHAAFNNSERIDIVRVGYHYVTENGDKIFHTVYASPIANPRDYILSNNLGPCHSVFILKRLAGAMGYFDESLKSAEDWDYWIRAVKAGARLSFIADPLVCYRYVQNSMSRDAFRMYNALKIVTLRAPKKDDRILIHSDFNRDYMVDIAPVIKFQLLRCLGVSVMQGKIKESVALFQSEKKKYELTFNPQDYLFMSSYLSFRYFHSAGELYTVFAEFVPRFKEFFRQIELYGKEMEVAIKVIFGAQYKIRNHQRYGRFLGALLNRLR